MREGRGGERKEGKGGKGSGRVASWLLGDGRPQWLKCKIRGGGTLHSGLGP